MFILLGQFPVIELQRFVLKFDIQVPGFEDPQFFTVLPEFTDVEVESAHGIDELLHPVATFLKFNLVDLVQGEQAVYLRAHQGKVFNQQVSFFLQVGDLLAGLGVAVVKSNKNPNDHCDQGNKDDPVVKISVLEIH